MDDREKDAATQEIKESVKSFYAGLIFKDSEYNNVELVKGDPNVVNKLTVGRQTGQRDYPAPRELTIAGYNLDNNPDELALVSKY